MENNKKEYEKKSISLRKDILEKGKKKALEKGLTFSAYIGYLISKDKDK